MINDWLDNNRVDKHLRDPLLHAGDPAPELVPRRRRATRAPRTTSTARCSQPSARTAAAAAARRRPERPQRPGSGPGPGTAARTDAGQRRAATSFFTSLGDRLGPGNAQSVPLPLLVLGGLALLLLLAAGGDLDRPPHPGPPRDAGAGARAASDAAQLAFLDLGSVAVPSGLVPTLPVPR